MPDEVPAGTETPHQAHEQSAPKLSTLGAVEKVVYEFAQILAAKQGIQAHHFDVRLVTKLRGIMAVQAGEVVQIYLLWPDAQPNIKTLLRSAFAAMQRYPMRRTMEIVPIALLKKMGDEHKKFCKEKFGEVGELLPDLISRTRLQMQTTTVTTLRDIKTGERISVTHESKWSRYDGDFVGLWLELSRVVRDKYHEAIHEDDNEIESETPILDATLREMHG